MSAYLIVDFDIRDQAAFQTYAKGVVPLIVKLGGKVLVAGGNFEVIDGQWQPHRLAIIQFPDRATIGAFFAHPEYADLARPSHNARQFLAGLAMSRDG